MFTTTFVPVYLLLGALSFTDASLWTIPYHNSFGPWPTQNLVDFWDPFYDDPFELELFHQNSLLFPEIYRRKYQRHMAESFPLVKRDDKDMFQLSLDVKGSSLHDLSVKIQGRELYIQGVYSCQQCHARDCCEKRFCWRRTLAKDVDINSVRATLSTKGTLEVTAKKERVSENKVKTVDIREGPVTQEQSQPRHNNNGLSEPVVEQERHKMDDYEEATVEVLHDEKDTSD